MWVVASLLIKTLKMKIFKAKASSIISAKTTHLQGKIILCWALTMSTRLVSREKRHCGSKSSSISRTWFNRFLTEIPRGRTGSHLAQTPKKWKIYTSNWLIRLGFKRRRRKRSSKKRRGKIGWELTSRGTYNSVREATASLLCWPQRSHGHPNKTKLLTWVGKDHSSWWTRLRLLKIIEQPLLAKTREPRTRPNRHQLNMLPQQLERCWDTTSRNSICQPMCILIKLSIWKTRWFKPAIRISTLRHLPNSKITGLWTQPWCTMPLVAFRSSWEALLSGNVCSEVLSSFTRWPSRSKRAC